MDEFDIINTYFAPLSQQLPAALGLKDDAAIIAHSPGCELVITTDTISEKTHFFSQDKADYIARKLLRVNLSDLAAMGATPRYALLNCSFPRSISEQWIKEFTAALAEDCITFRIPIIGGDTVVHDGMLTFSLTAIGEVPARQALLRSAANIDDIIYVTGTIGDSTLGLKVLKGELGGLTEDHSRYLIDRYHLPQPRLETAMRLRDHITCAMDISDGLLQDAGHITQCSGVSLTINSADIPLSAAAKTALAMDPSLLETVLTGGDDYELLFTVSKDKQATIEALKLPITAIGVVSEGHEVVMLGKDNQPMVFAKKGYRHFR